MELLEAPNHLPATHQHSAFFGRVVYHTRYSTLGDQSRMQSIYDGILATGALASNKTDAAGKPLLDSALADAAADFAAWLCLTPAMAFGPDRDHPELKSFYDFWRWWVDQAGQPVIDYARLWQWRMQLGWSVADQWKKAYNGAHAVSLGAPRPLLPDDLLSDQERADPNSLPGEKKAGPDSENDGAESQKASAVTSA